MKRIIPHLWFDKEAVLAASFYESVFKNTKILSSHVIKDTPSGDSEIVSISIDGYHMMFISAGPYFKINPSISFKVACDSKEEVQAYYDKLAVGGFVMMPLGDYPFSSHYAWVADRFGVSWQLIYTDKVKPMQKITPALMFVGDQCGKAKEATDFYVSLFSDSEGLEPEYYGEGMPVDAPDSVKQRHFKLQGQWFSAMDSAYDHKFSFNEAISLLVECENQEEIDRMWEALSAYPQAEQCGWLKDKYGLSWQITPTAMQMLMNTADPKGLERLTQAMLKMKKFNIAELEAAYKG